MEVRQQWPTFAKQQSQHRRGGVQVKWTLTLVLHSSIKTALMHNENVVNVSYYITRTVDDTTTVWYWCTYSDYSGPRGGVAA